MFTPRLRANNGEGLRQAALAGVGIVMQPEVLLGDDIKEKRLVRILPALAGSLATLACGVCSRSSDDAQAPMFHRLRGSAFQGCRLIPNHMLEVSK